MRAARSLNDERRIYSISELNAISRQILEGIEPDGLWVRGEIRRITFHASGHLYFSLTDGKATIDGVMWRSYLNRVSFKPEDGMELEIFGSPTLYEKTGRYQFSAKKMIPVGEGARAVAFRQLKEKLAKEGLFDSEHKRNLPVYPFRIGVVTSGTGAAIRDIVHVVSRRAPYVTLVLRASTVQGDKASHDIIKGLKELNEYGDVDLIIVGRGGGSEEDLWCFNDESLARAIFSSPLPVISAVGHEIDFTIADFVADVRAPTPSAAAEIAVRDIAELKNTIESAYLNCKKYLVRSAENHRSRLESTMTRPGWTELLRKIHENEQAIDSFNSRLESGVKFTYQRGVSRFNNLKNRLSNLNLKSILRRGFVLVKRNGQFIKASAELSQGDRITLVFVDGERSAEVIE